MVTLYVHQRSTLTLTYQKEDVHKPHGKHQAHSHPLLNAHLKLDKNRHWKGNHQNIEEDIDNRVCKEERVMAGAFAFMLTIPLVPVEGYWLAGENLCEK